jgi:two-component system sensor histidine kinase/response regulator
MMPHYNGFEVMEQLKALISSETYLPILVLTADISIETKQRALANGAKDFLVKPFDLIEVGLRIKNLLEIRILHQKLENQNTILEEKVKERTLELEKSNSNLLQVMVKAEESDNLKTSFLNNISHEIRTPFNGILGFLDMVYDESTSPEERKEYIGIINQSADRLMNTINSIVEISQIQAGQVKVNSVKTELSRLSKEIHYKFNPIANKKGFELAISNNLPEEIDVITTDSYKLKSILSILTDNAIKFTKAGSVELSISKNADTLEFTVKDTGVGIPKEKHLAIFERFRQSEITVTRSFEGSGLGLAIAKAYVELLGGEIWVESEEGKGSDFKFTLSIFTVSQPKTNF